MCSWAKQAIVINHRGTDIWWIGRWLEIVSSCDHSSVSACVCVDDVCAWERDEGGTRKCKALLISLSL